MRKAEKIFFVQNLTEQVKEASCLVLVDYTGLSVKMQQDLKKRLGQVNATLFVTKNTFFKLAAREAKMPQETLSDSVLSGQTAFVISEADPIAPLRVIAKFAEQFEIPQFKVGVIEGKFQDTESLVKLSKLPSKEVLLGQTVGTIASPMYALVSTLQGNLQKLVWVLNAKIKN